MVFYKAIYLSQVYTKAFFQKHFVQYVMDKCYYCSWKHKAANPHVFYKALSTYTSFS
jgi:hypothetical protein